MNDSRLAALPRPAPYAVFKHVVGADLSIYQPATLTLRWYALTLDLTFVGPLDVLIHLPFERYLERLHAYGFNAQYYALAALLTTIPIFFYFVAPTCLGGQTLGKRVVGIKVVSESKTPISAWQAVKREMIGKFLSVMTLGLGIITMLFDAKRRTLHDRVAGTVVLALKPEPADPEKRRRLKS